LSATNDQPDEAGKVDDLDDLIDWDAWEKHYGSDVNLLFGLN
jgi:hypothetical protein